MNIFLTGEVQIGKTTVIENALKLLNKDYGGFRTYFGPDRANPNRLLYMNSVVEPLNYSDDFAIVKISEFSKPQVIEDRFNTFGVELISNAIENKELIVMDECGRFERQSLEFQNQVINALDDEIPVLGVIKLDNNGWLDKIKAHPNVDIIYVNKENRNLLPAVLAERISKYIEKTKGL